MRIKKSLICSMLVALVASSIPTKNVNAEEGKVFNRVAGSSRYQTSVEVSKKCYTKSENVILANGKVFADALSGGQLALALNAPILLTTNNDVSVDVIKEVNRLEAKNIYILGGESTVSKGIEKKFAGKKIIRLAGKNRFSTSEKVMEETMKHGSFNELVIASGKSYPDALSASSYVYKKNALMLLSDGNFSNIKSKMNLVAVGGKNTLPLNGFNGKRIAGKDRYDTSVLIAQNSFGPTQRAILANGIDFPDALTAVSMVKKFEAPILLVKNNKVVYTDYLKNTKTFDLVGGKNSIGDDVITQLVYGRIPVVVDSSKIDEYEKSAKKYDRVRFSNLAEMDFTKINSLRRPKNESFYKIEGNPIGLKITHMGDLKGLKDFTAPDGTKIVIQKNEHKLFDFAILDEEQLNAYKKELGNTDEEGSMFFTLGTIEKNGETYYICAESGLIITPTTMKGEDEHKQIFRATVEAIRNIKGIGGAKVKIDNAALEKYAEEESSIELLCVLVTTTEVFKAIYEDLSDDVKAKSGVAPYLETMEKILNKGNVTYGSEDFKNFYIACNKVDKILSGIIAENILSGLSSNND